MRKNLGLVVLLALYIPCMLWALLVWAYDVIASFIVSLFEVQREIGAAHRSWVWHWRELKNPGIHQRELVNRMMPTSQRQEKVE